MRGAWKAAVPAVQLLPQSGPVEFADAVAPLHRHQQSVEIRQQCGDPIYPDFQYPPQLAERIRAARFAVRRL